MEQYNEKLELNILELFLFLKKKLYIVVLSTLLCALSVYVYSSFFVAPQYVADTRIYVLNRANETSVGTSDFQSSTYLLRDYRELLTGRNVTKEVISRLGLRMSPGALAGKLEISAPSNTRVLQISVRDTDPQRAAAIANEVREVAVYQIQNIMELDSIHLVYEAEAPTRPSSTGTMQKTGIGALVGAAISLVILITVFVLDDTIRNEEDVAHYLGLSVIGVIPLSADISVTRDDDMPRRRMPHPRNRKKVRK